MKFTNKQIDQMRQALEDPKEMERQTQEFEARERGKGLHHISERGSSDGEVKRMKRPFEQFVADHIAGRKGLLDDP